MAITCPACGSDSLSTEAKNIHIPVEYGRDIDIEETTYICNICGSDGDFADATDKKIEQALEHAKIEATELMLTRLTGGGITMAYFERAMGLPQRTLARWKKGKISAPGFALLRTVDTFPWILDVADAKFNKKHAVTKMMESATATLHEILEPHVVHAEGAITSNGDTAKIALSLELKKGPNTASTVNIHSANSTPPAIIVQQSINYAEER